MKRIDVLAYKWDVDNTDSFNEDIITYSTNSIIINWNYNKIWIQYKPENIELNKISINFFKIGDRRSLLTTIIHIVQVFKFLLSICWKFRPKIFIVENYLEGVIVGILRKCNLVKKTIYLPCDWFAGIKYKRLASNIANNLFFPYADLLACKLNDVVVDRPGTITESRNKYWGEKIPTTKRQLIQQPRIQATNICIDKKRPYICFIGELREDCGIDIAIKALNKIRRQLDTKIKIIGPKRLHYEHFMKLPYESAVSQYINFLGFIDRKDFNEVLSDCFCGINILNTMNSYSTQGTPSKIMHYLQYFLPVIVTEGIPKDTLSNIRDNRLGVVIKPVEDEFIKAILEVYANQESYRKNIKRYIESLPRSGIINFLKDQDL